MQAVQRRQFDRISVARPLDIELRGGAARVSGYTRNLSEAGVSARVDEALPVGRLCLVQLTLADEARPADTCAEVVWCRKDLYGSGAEVGLRLLAPDEVDTAAQPGVEEASWVPAGSVVRVSYGGKVFEACVTKECQLSGGEAATELSLTLTREIGQRPLAAVADEAPTPEADAELLADAEEWKPRPLEEAWLTVRKYAMPVAVVLLAIARPLWRFLCPWLLRAWHRVPARHRDRAQRLWQRLDLQRRAVVFSRFCYQFAVKVRDEVRARHAALSASRR